MQTVYAATTEIIHLYIDCTQISLVHRLLLALTITCLPLTSRKAPMLAYNHATVQTYKSIKIGFFYKIQQPTPDHHLETECDDRLAQVLRQSQNLK